MVSVESVAEKLAKLSQRQLNYLNSALEGLIEPIDVTRLEGSDIASEIFVEEFGNRLKAHHGVSSKALTKQHFERAMEEACNVCGMPATLNTPNFPGCDIKIQGQTFSLKTQGDKAIKPEKLWISKFMELGTGEWTDQVEQLRVLTGQFLNHLSKYNRILSLRNFHRKTGDKTLWKYELLEIPVELLLNANQGEYSMNVTSTQSAKPGTCKVTDSQGLAFQLYFDGGTERKLHIQHLRKNLCKEHATWTFYIADSPAQPPSGDVSILSLEFNADEPAV
jgi:hypothetical protein